MGNRRCIPVKAGQPRYQIDARTLEAVPCRVGMVSVAMFGLILATAFLPDTRRQRR